jgi:hypothetical protein
VNTLRQIIAIARTEFRFGLRRGGPVVPMVLIGLVIDVSVVWMTIGGVNAFKWNMNYNFYSDPAKMQKLQAAGIHLPTLIDEADLINTESLIGSWSYFYILTFLLLVSAVAPTIPADRQFGVMEILRSLPISGGRYLAGKILGVLAVAGTVAAVPLIAYFFIPLILVGAVSIKLLALLILMDGIPVLLGAVSLGVQSGVLFGKRTLAAAFGFVAGIIGLVGIILTSKANPYMGGDFVTPAAAYISRITDTSGMPLPQGSVHELGMYYGGALIFLVLLGILARSWLKWKENF